MNPTLAIALGSILSALIAYLAAVKRLSGRIETSSAEELWAESRAIREALTERNEFLSEKISTLEERVDELAARNRDLYLENGNLRRVMVEHEKTIQSLRDEMASLRTDNDRLRAENGTLRNRVDELEAHNGT